MIHPRTDYTRRIQDSENLIPENEPVILFRAQDTLAIEPLKLYAELCEKHQAPKVAAKIRRHIALMEAWPKKKIPDVPEGV